MTASDVQAGTWAPCGPPFSSYEASDGQDTGRGQVRSVDRTLADGRRRRGVLLAQRKSSRGYWQVNVTDDDGRKCAGVPVHRLMMLAHEPEPCPPGMQVRHFDDDPDHNVWAPGGEAAILAGGPGNLVYGDAKQQWDDKLRNRYEPGNLRWGTQSDPLPDRKPVTVRDVKPKPRRSRRVITTVRDTLRRWFP